MGGFRILIAGGGVAAVEAMLALDDLAGDRVEVELIAPTERFVYRPHLVAEPFSLASPTRSSSPGLAGEHGASDRARLARLGGRRFALDPNRQRSDARLRRVADRDRCAHRSRQWTGRSASETAPNASLPQPLGATRVGSPRRGWCSRCPGVPWALPAYELALLSAAHLRARGIAGVEITLVTYEARPLELLGESAPEVVAELLAEAGITLVTGSAPHRFEAPRLQLRDGGELAADHVVALPALEVGEIDGIPQRSGGFIPADGRLNVEGLVDVWVAGDATWFPIKHGGLAAQQADVAAEAIASRAGLTVPGLDLPAVLRAALLTGALPRFFRSATFAGFDEAASPGRPLVAAVEAGGTLRRPHLSAAAHSGRGEGEFVDLEPPKPSELADERAHRRYEMDFALAAADADARKHDYEGALAWLDLVEELAIVLPRRTSSAGMLGGMGAPPRPTTDLATSQPGYGRLRASGAPGLDRPRT